MTLYHGTTLDVANKIADEGFRLDVDHIWNDHEEYVYFTDSFIVAASHAGCAAWVRGDYPAVVRCEIEPDDRSIYRMDMTHTIGKSTFSMQIYGLKSPDIQYVRPQEILAWRPE